MGFVSVLYLLTSLGFAAVLGVAYGRRAERRHLLSPVVLGSGERRLGDYEDQLRRKVGARRMHPDPENASRQRMARPGRHVRRER